MLDAARELTAAEAIHVDASDVRDVTLRDVADSETHRKITVFWRDAIGRDHLHPISGAAALQFHRDVDRLRNHGGKEQVAAYVLGIIRFARH